MTPNVHIKDPDLFLFGDPKVKNYYPLQVPQVYTGQLYCQFFHMSAFWDPPISKLEYFSSHLHILVNLPTVFPFPHRSFFRFSPVFCYFCIPSFRFPFFFNARGGGDGDFLTPSHCSKTRIIQGRNWYTVSTGGPGLGGEYSGHRQTRLKGGPLL